MENNQSLLNAVMGVMSSNKALAEATEKLLKEKYKVTHEKQLNNDQRITFEEDVKALSAGPTDLTEETVKEEPVDEAVAKSGRTPAYLATISKDDPEYKSKIDTLRKGNGSLRVRGRLAKDASPELRAKYKRSKEGFGPRDVKVADGNRVDVYKKKLREMKEYGVDGERERAAKGERYDRTGKIVNKIKARKAGKTDTGKKASEVEVKEQNLQELSTKKIQNYIYKSSRDQKDTRKSLNKQQRSGPQQFNGRAEYNNYVGTSGKSNANLERRNLNRKKGLKLARKKLETSK